MPSSETKLKMAEKRLAELNKIEDEDSLSIKEIFEKRKLMEKIKKYEDRVYEKAEEAAVKEMRETRAAKKIAKAVDEAALRRLENKVFSTTMIAQQARKAAAREAEMKALAIEKPVIKKPRIKHAFSPKETSVY